MPTVIVCGAVANKPLNGGSVWERMSWAAGLRRLGCSVYFLECIHPDACRAADGSSSTFRSSINLSFFEEAIAPFELDGAALVLGDGEDSVGMAWEDVVALAESADLVVDIGVHLAHSRLLSRCRRKVLIDVDPGFTQIWHVTGALGDVLARYDVHFTVGENIGQPQCGIPAGGYRWRPIRQPVVLDDWPKHCADELHRLTTLSSWRGPYGPLAYRGHSYGLKMHEWRKVARLPRVAPFAFELALDIDPSEDRDLHLLSHNGWRLVDPRRVAGDADAFRAYVQASDAEFSVAQGVYVDTNSGWFSDRSTRYLASGKPVLVQDTGFGRVLPTGDGIVPFRSLAEAANGAARIALAYSSHARAARQIAEESFDSDAILAEFLDQVGT